MGYSTVGGGGGGVTDHAALTGLTVGDDHTQYQKESEKGAINGYASLDAGGTVPDAQIPAAIARDSELHNAVTIGADGEHSLATQVLSGVDATNLQKGHAKVGADTPTTQAFGDAAVVGAGDGAANSLHKHAMPANPVTAHEAAADPHTGYRKESESGTFSVGATILNPATGTTIMAWRAPFACTVTNVRCHFKGGTSVVYNAQKNQASTHLAANQTNSTANAWADGGAVQNTAYAAGDDLELMFVTITGAVTEASIQVDFTRP